MFQNGRLMDISEDLYLEIALYLDVNSFYNFTSTNKYFRELLDSETYYKNKMNH